MTTTTAIRGGAWLTEDVDAASVLTPERLSDEHRLIGRTAEAFIDNEVLPVLDRLEAKEWTLARELIHAAVLKSIHLQLPHADPFNV